MKRLSVSCNQIGQVGDSVSPTRPIVACGHVGQWLLIVGPNTIRPILANVIAGLAIEEPVRVLDDGPWRNRIFDWLVPSITNATNLTNTLMGTRSTNNS
jgi:hypothetical protein